MEISFQTKEEYLNEFGLMLEEASIINLPSVSILESTNNINLFSKLIKQIFLNSSKETKSQVGFLKSF